MNREKVEERERERRTVRRDGEREQCEYEKRIFAYGIMKRVWLRRGRTSSRCNIEDGDRQNELGRDQRSDERE